MKPAYTESELHRFFELALKLAHEGGEILRHYWGHLQDVQSKDGTGNLVTEADKASEKRILELLHDHYPSHAVLAEESGEHKSGDSPFLWAIDPLDGTTNYAHQLPVVAVSVALLYGGFPIVGVVYNPILNDIFHAQLDGGAFLNGKKLRVSKVKELGKSLLATGFPYNRRNNPENNYAEFSRLTDLSQGVRRLGSAALDMANVAAGRYDGYWELGIQTWDVAAGTLLVTEAGGKVTGYDGSPVDLFSGKILATNGLLHEQLSKELLR